MTWATWVPWLVALISPHRSSVGGPVSATLQPQIAASFLGGRQSASGRFFLAPLPPTVPVTLDVWSNVGHPFQRATLPVENLLVGSPTPIEIRLPLGTTVSGVVTDKDGAAIAHRFRSALGVAKA